MDPLSRPIFIVAPPQSGTTYLQAALERYPQIRGLGIAARAVFEGAEELRPALRGHDSNRRTAEDATPTTAERARAELRTAVLDEDEVWREGARLVDATPRNSLRVPYLDAIFPDATFVYIYREPRETVSNMVEAWRSGEYVTHPQLPDWPGPPWSLLLIPGWRELAGSTVPEIATEQWIVTTRTLLDDLRELPPHRWSVVDFGALSADPEAEVERVAGFLGLDAQPEGVLAPPPQHLAAPTAEAAARRSERLQATLPRTIGLAEAARDLIARPVSPRPTVTPDADSPLRSIYTGRFHTLLVQLGTSLLVSAPTAGKLIVVREDGIRVNTHFRDLARPTGIALGDGWLAVGTHAEIWRYRAATAAPASAAGDDRDHYFLPLHRHYTGDIGTRALASVGDQPWIVSSALSCLATLDDLHNVVPRWRPPFVSEIAADDRCHLTGLAAVDGRAGFVTALGESDVPHGWREQKRDGGCIVEVESGEVAAGGLSLPHSPCWHDGRLWFCESGEGALCTLDPRSGEKEVVASLPGFARGLAIAGDVAFVGLSRLRPGPEDQGLPVAEAFEEHFCGVWAVDTRSGATRGFLRFGGEIDEVFEIAALRGARSPEVADPAGELARYAITMPDELTSVPD